MLYKRIGICILSICIGVFISVFSHSIPASTMSETEALELEQMYNHIDSQSNSNQ